MPDWRDNQIEDNIRNGFVKSSTHDADASIKKSRLELESTPTNDLTRNHITTNNDGFGVITNKSFENGSASGARGLVENGGNGTSYGENDFAYYDWPAIDNFEDVDRMFRNCDSTFGQKETMEDGGEELSWFATSSDAVYASEMEALNDFATYSSGKPDLQASPSAEGENAFASTQMECQGEEIDQLLVNETYNGGGSLNGYGTLDMDQKHLVDPGASSYLTFNSFAPGMEASPSQVQPPTPKGPSALQKKTEKLKNGQLMNMIEQPPMEKPSFGGSNCKDEFENGVDESKSILDSSMVLNGSSSNNSTFSTNHLSVEETSFRQLQDVMNQLDVKTKLCIRDSLYRLARSVQHRNDFSNGSKSYGTGHAQYSAMNNGFVEPINSETGTNPIDRSIAELLFHQTPSPNPNPNPNSNIGNIEDANSPKSRVSSE